ncbi:MAG: efflux RND transporter periplasmic adaptor subunit [Bacteroidetes bacterium]|nr:efflux RND transporter periplasmic adaptor subunit [Bacteroidota bacterium]
MRTSIILGTIFLAFSCKDKVEKIRPNYEPISESIYASGIVKSNDQYQVYASVNGIVDEVFVDEGDVVKKGSPILRIFNETQRLNKENAELNSAFSDINSNQGKLNEAKLFIDLARNKMRSDSTLFARYSSLWSQNIGTKVELEQRELAYQNSKNAYYSAMVKYDDLKRQLVLVSEQSKKNVLISSRMEGDYTVSSKIDGIVYSILKSKGEIVGAQTPIAVIGNSASFNLEMQVDEYDILKVSEGMKVMVTLDSYKGKVFEAVVTKINPLMNERSKTFMINAKFVQQPERLYPNITFEANILLNAKEKALLIPRNYIENDSFVTKANGDRVAVRTGLRDYQKIEILSGISERDELIKPVK